MARSAYPCWVMSIQAYTYRRHDERPNPSNFERAAAAGGRVIISAADRAVLRRLASQVAELAARPIEAEKRDLWYRHNALEATRPLIFCDPENGWDEIITAADLACEGELARGWEMRLRKEIFWGAMMCDDRVIEPYFNVRHVYTESDWGMHETGSAANTVAPTAGSRRSSLTPISTSSISPISP